MDKIAIISDIHSNVPALEAVLEDIRSRGINRIICLGDIIGKGPEPQKALEIVINSCNTILLGNWDEFIRKDERDNINVLKWNREKIDSNWLEKIDEFQMYEEFYLSGRLVRFAHAQVEDTSYRIYPHSSISDKEKLFFAPKDSTYKRNLSDIFVYGDIHNSFTEIMEDQKILINSGSVGNPLDGSDSSYLIMWGDFNSKEISNMGYQIVRVKYDIKKTVKLCKKYRIPEKDEFINELISGKYRGIK